jgi:GNAT superfamily N-acetyltransferase
LKGFAKRKLLHKASSASDGRQNVLSLTESGRKVFAPLDAAAHEEVRKLLEGLSQERQDELVSAMRNIERLLGDREKKPASYILRNPQPGDMGWVVQRHGALYAREYRYDERFGALVAEIVAKFVQSFDARSDRCWIAEREDENVRSVFLVRHTKTVAKLRLLLVEPGARGMGIGGRLVQECVRFAKQLGYKKIILWTQSELKAARAIYEKAGFQLVKEEAHQSWSREDLVAETWELGI